MNRQKWRPRRKCIGTERLQGRPANETIDINDAHMKKYWHWRSKRKSQWWKYLHRQRPPWKKKFEQKRAFESLNNEIQTDYRKTKQRWVSKNLKNGTQNDYRKFKQKIFSLEKFGEWSLKTDSENSKKKELVRKSLVWRMKSNRKFKQKY